MFISQIYLIAFLVGIVYAVIAGIMAGISGHGEGDGGHDADGHDFHAEHDHDVDLDHDLDVDHDHDFIGGHEHHGGLSALEMDMDSGIILTPVSPVTIATFITSFGGTGLIATEVLHFPLFLSIPFAVIFGIGIAGTVLYGFNKIFQATQASSEARIFSLVGTEAEVITPIPADGIGEIAYISRGSRFTGPARSVNKHIIARNANVVITKILGTTFYVRETVDEELRNVS